MKGHYKSHGYNFFLKGTENLEYKETAGLSACLGHKKDYDCLHTYTTKHEAGTVNPGDVYGMSSWSSVTIDSRIGPGQGDNLTFFSIIKQYE